MFVYLTAIWTHHQEGVCRELHNLIGDGFKMVLTLPLDAPLSRERVAMGWDLVPPDEDWIVGPPKTKAEARAIDYAPYVLAPEVAVFGYVPFLDEMLITRRVRSGKLTFFQGERFFKKPRRLADWFNPHILKRWFCIWCKLHPKNAHYLTMNHWCADDLRFFHVCKGRTWQWGYLTAVSPVQPQKPKHERVEIGWCGRMIYWKRVDYILKAFALLPDNVRQRCRLTLVGNGDKEAELKDLADGLALSDIVEFKKPVSAAEALGFMHNLDIYVMPSDREEGWGAALLEAMNEGCAVVSNKSAGATLDVIEDGKSGFAFEDGDIKMLAERLCALIEDATLRHEMGKAAWRRVQEWSPRVGAERLVAVVNALSGVGQFPEYKGGLMSLRR